MAAGAARRLVSQCRAHADQATRKMSDRVNSADPSTPCKIDVDRASGTELHYLAFSHLVQSIETMSNALVSHLRGLQLLLAADTFLPLPAMTVTRSIAEVAGSTAWVLRPGLSADERTARSCASLFAVLEKGIGIGSLREADQEHVLREKQAQLIRVLEGSDPTVSVIHRVKDGVEQEDVAQIKVGRARAKTQFKHSHRLTTEIPAIGGLYGQMSAATHGEHAAISASFDTPSSYARAIGYVTLESTKAWSLAVHTWVGVTPGQFWNDADRMNLSHSIPAFERAELMSSLVARETLEL